ncbi:MAG TPA: hypothetical protein VHM70_19920 [Polyangiaceae bacterium]|jgi:hypothetical protein|nr:hypothetical protein [Polyangiaceae bacterium]
MPKVKTTECPKCGAPLNVATGATQGICQFCGTVCQVEWGKKLRAVRQAPLTVYVPNPVPTRLLAAVGVSVLAILGTVIGISMSARPVANPAAVAATDAEAVPITTLPATCGEHQEVLIVGQKFEGAGTLISARDGCQVTIKDSTLKGNIVVLSQGYGVAVSVVGSTLEGTEYAFKGGDSSKLAGNDNAVFKGAEAAIFVGQNSQLTFNGVSVESAKVGIQASGNLNVSATSSKIVGKNHGLRGASNITVDGTALSMKGGTAALEFELNLHLTLSGGLLEGGEAAILTRDANADLKLSHGAALKGHESALSVPSNLQLDMEEASIDGDESGIVVQSNPKLHLGPKARIHGAKFAVKITMGNLELDMRDATIESESVAVCSTTVIKLIAHGSKLSGGVDAFRFGRQPREINLVETTVSGKQRFNAKNCDLR